MRQRQRGITFIGWIVLLVPFAIVGYAAIRMTPIYLNYMKVAKAMEQVATDSRGDEQINVQALRSSLRKHFEIDSVDFPMPEQVAFVRDGKQWVAELRYEDTAPLFGNIGLLVRFDKRVPIS